MILSDSFLLTNFTIKILTDWQNSFETAVYDNLQCLKDSHQFRSPYGFRIQFVQDFDLKFHLKSQILRHCYCGCVIALICFSKIIILFLSFCSTFLTIINSLSSLSLAAARGSTFSESSDIWLYYPWVSLPTITFPFKHLI